MFSLAKNFQVGKTVTIDISMPCSNVITEVATVGNLQDDVVSFIFNGAKGFFLTKPTNADVSIELPEETACYRMTIIPNSSLPFMTARIVDRIRITEKRQYKRINSWLPVHCLYDAGIDTPPKTVFGKMNVNISGGGIKFRLPEQLPPGKNVVLAIGLPVGPEMISILAHVIHSTYNQYLDAYLTPFEFTFISNEDRDTIKSLVERMDAGRRWQERDRTLFRFELYGGNCLKAVLRCAKIL